jgi:hypothetical protein
MVVESNGSVNTGLRVAVKGVEQRVAIRIVVGRQLCFDVRQGNITAHSNVQTLRYLWDVEVRVNLDGVISVFFAKARGLVWASLCFAAEEFLAQNAFGGGEAVI